jgi:hypothetical protein
MLRAMSDPSQVAALLDAVRRASQKAPPESEPLHGVDGPFWSAHERALVRARDAVAAAQRIVASAARHRGSIDAVAEGIRGAHGRVAELQAGAARVVDALERLGLVALNAGLEAARLGEAEGRALALVGEEVRAQAARGSDVARSLAAGFAETLGALGRLGAQTDHAHAVVAEVTQDATRAAGASTDAEGALVDLGERVRSTTGSDPETIRAVVEASEKARALVVSLGALHGKVRSDALLGALMPLFEPLALVLAAASDVADSEGD